MTSIISIIIINKTEVQTWIIRNKRQLQRDPTVQGKIDGAVDETSEELKSAHFNPHRKVSVFWSWMSVTKLMQFNLIELLVCSHSILRHTQELNNLQLAYCLVSHFSIQMFYSEIQFFFNLTTD